MFEEQRRTLRNIERQMSFSFDRVQDINAASYRSRQTRDVCAQHAVALWTYGYVTRYFVRACARGSAMGEVDCDLLIDRALHRIEGHAHTLRDAASYAGWVATLCRHVLIDHIRAAGREADALAALVRSREDPEARLEFSLTLQEVAQTIEKLPPHVRRVARLRLVDGWPYAEISRATGKPVATLRAYIQKARRMLRIRLGFFLPEGDEAVSRRTVRRGRAKTL